jgi:hypothetical protein
MDTIDPDNPGKPAAQVTQPQEDEEDDGPDNPDTATLLAEAAEEDSEPEPEVARMKPPTRSGSSPVQSPSHPCWHNISSRLSGCMVQPRNHPWLP